MEETLNFHTILIAGVILTASFLFCYFPIYVSSFKKLRKHFQFISAAAVGLLLAVLLIDIIPHVILGPCHNKTENLHHGHTHETHETHTHETHTHGHKYKNHALLTSGITFMFLLAIDTLFLHHGECETSTKKKQKSECKDTSTHDHDEIYNESPESLGLCNTSSIKQTKTVLQALIFVGAISIHSFLEGLAANRSKTKTGISSYEVALVVHKILESIGLSISIQQTAFSKTVFFMLFSLFSIATPVAMLLSVWLRPDTLIFCLANGAAMGSVIFIVFVEMIPSLFHGHTNKSKRVSIGKMICFFISFGITGSLIIYTHK
ncbi:Zinc transporter 7 [Cucumispora dikerogammari]|nr:Zinc transporter 7 [Cucumispora dikerogammari]